MSFFVNNLGFLGFILAILAFLRPELENLAHKIFNSIDFYPHSRIELGFFDFGPTIGIQCTLRGRGGNQLIRSIYLDLTRQRDGATYSYKWGVFRNFSASQNAGNIEESLKAELATAFLLSKDGSKVLNIQFHDVATKERFTDDLLQLKTRFEEFVRSQAPIVDESQLVSIQERFKAIPENDKLVLQAFSKLGKEFYWEEGRYKICLHVETDKPHKLFKFEYSFSLSSQEVANMELNKVGLIQVMMSTPPSHVNFAHVEIQNKS